LDTGSGVKEVVFFYHYCPESNSGLCGPRHLIGTDSSSPYEQLWTFPLCGEADEPRWFSVRARAEDNCGNQAWDRVDNIVLGGRGCFRDAAGPADSRITSWVSELAVPGARGQVVVDGAQAVFPGPGTAAHALALSPGPHRFEAVLVDASGEAGVWRFHLATLGLAPGSIRVVAGDVAEIGPDQVAFRLAGQPGERVVFTLQIGER
jgi:hypothetical protein